MSAEALRGRIAVVEVKHGEGALDGRSGLGKHVEVCSFSLLLSVFYASQQTPSSLLWPATVARRTPASSSSRSASVQSAASGSADLGDAIGDMLEQDGVPVRRVHRGTASLNTRSRMDGYRNPSVTTSTDLWSSSSASTARPQSANAEVPGGASTSRSTSLSGSSSPRAIDPNT